MSKIENMNKYVANLAVLNVKLHNLHWNVVGQQFVALHKFTEELYDEVFEKYDEVAEQVKILGETPLSTLKQYLEVSTVEEVAAKAFSTDEVLSILSQDLTLMNELAKTIRAAADSEGDFNTVAIFEAHSASYEKNLWFIKALRS